MRRSARTKKHMPIDKSQLSFGCKVRLKDKAYLGSYRTAHCIVCATPETVVPAHIRTGWLGIGSKPDDSLTLPLCYRCHHRQHEIGETRFWRETKGWTIGWTKKVARQRYEVWKNG